MFQSPRPPVPEVTTEEAQERLLGPEAPLLVDVREPDEYAEGHVPGSRHIPLGTLPLRLSELSRDHELLLMCRSGARSARATQLLLEAGYKATNVAGGMLAWQGQIER